MSEENEEHYVSIDTAIKSISIHQLEECIAYAVQAETGSSKLKCAISKIESVLMDGVKLEISLNNNLGEMPFLSSNS